MTSSAYVVIYVVFDNKLKVINWFFICMPFKLTRYIVSCVLVFFVIINNVFPFGSLYQDKNVKNGDEIVNCFAKGGYRYCIL